MIVTGCSIFFIPYAFMIDNQLTQNMQAWLASDDHDNASLIQGAEMVLKLTPPASGIRPDHDSLPDSIHQLWTDNRSRWLRIKQLYNTLLGIEKPCDRYEYLAQLKDLWYTYKRALQRYDSYVASASDAADGASEADTEPSPSAIAKVISNARSYVSKNIDRLTELRQASIKSDDATKELDEYNALHGKMQQRIDVLCANGAPIGDDLKAKLDEAGLSVPTSE